LHQSSAPGDPDRPGRRIDCWRNEILPYLKSVEVFACPANPFSRSVPGQPGHYPPNPGDNAEGWELAAGGRMPISYGMNSCSTNWSPADVRGGPPPLRLAAVGRAADTILIAESQWPSSDVHAGWLIGICPGLYTHSAGRVANFIFFDGHARSKKWLSTLYPL